MSIWLSMLVVVMTIMHLTKTYKILYISPVPAGKSHAILSEEIVKHLALAGHEVTYIASRIPDEPLKAVSIIDISDNEKFLRLLNIKSIMNKEAESSVLFTWPVLVNFTRNTMVNPDIVKFLSNKTIKIDVVIVEWMFIDIYAGLSAIFNCPLIWFSTIEPHWRILRLIGEIPDPAYTADIFSNAIPPLNFVQRIWELYYRIHGQIIYLQKSYIENEIYEDLFVPHIKNRGHAVQSFDALKYNGSLILTNSHVSISTATRLPPNIISIGGYHINPNVKPLPEILQKIMDKAKYGVIYLSMGSNLKSKDIPYEVKQTLLKVFGELNQTVLWKIEEDLSKRPSNVHILKWAPQQSILAHKNCVLFITHGGLLSITEAIHFGVPIIGIPVFADQFINIDRGVKKGYAIKVDLSYSMADHIKTAVQEILMESRYTDKVKELSRIYHDRPVHPTRELVHWVEHVVRTGGARHLRTAAFLMPWYQKIYLDLVLLLLAIVITIKYTFRYICSSFRSKKSAKRKSKQN